MARTSASLSDGATGSPIAAVLGPAVVCAAALAVPLVYLPNLNSVFAEPKMALLYIAGALGFAGRMLAWGFAPSSSSSSSPSSSSVRLSPALQIAVASLLATTLVAAAVAAARGAPGAPYAGAEIARLLAVVGVAFAAAQATADPRWLRRLLTSIHISAGLVSLIGLLQHLQILPLAIPTISVPGSTFGNRNIAAEAVAMSIPFGLGWLALARQGGVGAKDVAPAPASRDARTTGAADDVWRRDPVGAILFLLALELVYLGATRTRGAWLGAASGIAVFFGLRWLAGQRGRAVPRAGVALALALGVAALAAAVIPGRVIPRDVADAKRFEPGPHVVREVVDPTSPVVRTRLGLWRRTLTMYRAHPLLGVGPGNFTVFFPLYAEPGARADGVLTPTVVPRRAHQDLLERLAETGVVGLAALLAVYVVAAGIAVRRSRRAGEETGRSGGDAATVAPAAPGAALGAALTLAALDDRAAQAASAAAALAVLFTCGLTGFPLAMPGTALLFGVALGVLAAKRVSATAPAPARVSAPLAPAGSRAGARFAVVLVAAVLVTGAVVGASRSVRRSYWLARARAALRTPDRPGLGPLAALEALRRAERADSGQFEVALETGFVLLRLGRAADARRAVDRALAIEPHCANAWALRAEADLGADDAPQAAADADRATAILNDYPDAVATRGRAGQQLGDLRALQAARDHLAALAAAGDDRAGRLLGSLPPGAGPR